MMPALGVHRRRVDQEASIEDAAGPGDRAAIERKVRRAIEPELASLLDGVQQQGRIGRQVEQGALPPGGIAHTR